MSADTCGAVLKQKLSNFVGWMQELGVQVENTASLHSMPEALVMAAVQETLLEHKEIVKSRQLDTLCNAVNASGDKDLLAAMDAFKSKADSLTEEQLDKFWRYMDLFVLLVE